MVQSVTSNLQLVISARDEASKQLKGLSKNIKGLEPTFKKMAKFGTVAFAAIGFGVFKATQLAVDAQETFNKFEVVFQDVSDQAEAAAQDLRDNFGLAGSSARKLLSDTGDMLVGLGVAGDAALDLSLKTQKLAVDLASFTNIEGGATRASEALTKGLLGERESMKALGIVINETDVKLRLLENGTANLTGTALKAARAQATLELAMEQSKSAIGDFARTSDQVANQQRVLQERFKELSESVGALFIPILAALVSKLLPVVESITDWAIANPTLAKTVIQLTLAISGLIAVLGVLGLIVPNISSGFKSMTGVIVLLRTGIIKLATVIGTTLVLAGRSALLSIGNFNVLLGTLASRVVPAVIAGMSRLGFVIGTTLRGAVLFAVNALRVSLLSVLVTLSQIVVPALIVVFEILGGVIAFLTSPIGLLVVAIAGLILILVSLAQKYDITWDKIKKRAIADTQLLRETFTNFAKSFSESWNTLWTNVGATFLGVWDQIVLGFKTAVNFIISQINRVISAINVLINAFNKVATLGGRLGGGLPNIPNIPELADGGIVTKPTLAMIGEDGAEAVVPLNRGAGAGGFGGGITVNIGTIIGAGMDLDEFSEMIGDNLMEQVNKSLRI